MKLGKYVSNFLKAKDITAPVTATISAVEVVSFRDQEKGGERDSVVLFFKELEQGVVTCKSSLRQLIEILESDDSDNWIGKKVILFNDADVQYRGRRIGGIRFRAAS